MKFQLTLHRKLWMWLADNPEMEKEDWHGWDDGYRDEFDEITVVGNCFACEYDSLHRNTCKDCPLVWPNKDNSCVSADNGLFSLWESTDNPETRANLARTIAELPVREGVECI